MDVIANINIESRKLLDGFLNFPVVKVLVFALIIMIGCFDEPSVGERPSDFPELLREDQNSLNQVRQPDDSD